MIGVLRDRRLWLVSAAVAAGIAVGLIVSFAGSASHRAEASVLVSSKNGPSSVAPFLPDLKTLAASSLLAGNIKSTLRLSDSEESVRHRLHASIRPQTQVIVISGTGDDARSAQQLTQEAAVVFALLVGERFQTTTPPLHATVLDPAHVLSGPDRHLPRNPLIGAVLGLLLGTAAVLLFGGASGVPAQAASRETRDLTRREGLLERRIETVTARERELVSRAAALATQERELQQQTAALGAGHEVAREPERAPEPEVLVPQPEPEPEPALAPPPPRPAVARIGVWNVNDLESVVGANSVAHPERADEWRTYLFFLRDHASIDGDLPPQFDSLITEVFGELIESR